MTRLWDKGDALDPEVLAYTTGDDPEMDVWLVAEDCWGSLAHARMRASGSPHGGRSALDRRGLRAVLARGRAAEQFRSRRDEEDVHTAIENRLTRPSGEAGRRVHIGRSRNDQVLACLRLFGKRRLLDVEDAASDARARAPRPRAAHEKTPLPGYTHLRRAMPSSVGLWAAGFAELVTDDLELLAQARAAQDRSPLGSAAGFGVPLPLDRARTASSSASRASRPTSRRSRARGARPRPTPCSRLSSSDTRSRSSSWDLELYAAPEFGFVQARGTTSRPEARSCRRKRNPDVLELTRANSAVLESHLHRVLSVSGRLPSSYHRDYQVTKEPLHPGASSWRGPWRGP